MAKVHFFLGSGSGALQVKIAREYLTEDLNPSRTMSFLRETLRGVSDQLVLDLLSGLYALGEIANMLHNKLADRLLDAHIIPWGHALQDGGKRMENPDRWLEEHGWVKIHGPLVQYEGYARSTYRKDGPIPLTDQQIEALCAYGDRCCDGILSLGHAGNHVRVSRFRATEPLMLHKYFRR